jgi:transcriptional regulator with XRE-family HTH domain
MYGMRGSTDVLTRLGRRVRDLRKARQLSQEDFAAECGLDRTYISGIERGVRNVSLRNLDLIARTLDISLSELFEGV